MEKDLIPAAASLWKFSWIMKRMRQMKKGLKHNNNYYYPTSLS